MFFRITFCKQDFTAFPFDALKFVFSYFVFRYNTNCLKKKKNLTPSALTWLRFLHFAIVTYKNRYLL